MRPAPCARPTSLTAVAVQAWIHHRSHRFHIQAAIEEDKAVADQASPAPTSLQLPDFGDEAPADIDAKRVSMLSDVDLNVKIELGRTRMLVEDVLELGQGSVVELDKLAGDPVGNALSR